MPKLKFAPFSGYRRLDSYVMASIIQLANFEFCRRFIKREHDPTGHLFDQMTQAARSGVANIVEGSARAATSRETEMKLTDVAQASLVELHRDYEFWLMLHEQAPWERESDESKAIFALRLDRAAYGTDFVRDSCLHILAQKRKFDRWLKSDDSLVFANAMLLLISRVIQMLLRQREAQGADFLEKGGFREQLTTERVEARAAAENAPDCPDCGKPMKKRTARSGKTPGSIFWGCTGYPDCRGTREVATGVDSNRRESSGLDR